MTDYLIIPPILGLGGLAVAFIIYHIMSRHNHGDGAVKHIGDQIHLGAMVFMKREYTMLGLFSLVLLSRYFRIASGRKYSDRICSRGTVLSDRRVPGHVRRHQGQCSHRDRSAQPRPGPGAVHRFLRWVGHGTVCRFSGPGRPGRHLLVLSAATQKPHTLFTASVWAHRWWPCFRVSAAGSLPRAPTWVQTWWARLKPGYPRMTPVTPGVIADNVGDNVGDIAGMGSDIFESYCGSMIACIAIASTMVTDATGSNDVPATDPGQHRATGFNLRHRHCARSFRRGTRGGPAHRDHAGSGYFRHHRLVLIQPWDPAGQYLVFRYLRRGRRCGHRPDHRVLHWLQRRYNALPNPVKPVRPR